MKKLLILLLSLLTLFTLFGCGEEDDVPEGMQLVSGSDELGYYFYAPEEWTVSNLGNISAAYASTIDNSSLSFAEIDSGEFPLSEGETAEDYFFNRYFEDSLSEFPDGLKPNVTVNAEPCLFGTEDEGADRAVKYVYEYTYSEHPFGFIQILTSHDNNFYIFTYSAQKSKRTETDSSTRYDYYIENDKVQSTIDSFRFVKKTDSAKESFDYEKDSDGFILSTEKDKAGFELYLPEQFKIDYSSAVVSATHSDGSNITLTKAMRAGVAANEYWETRKKELSLIVDELEVIKEAEPASLGNNSQWAFSYEYTYVYNGEIYHVYQILAVDGFLFFADGYVFTYTAKEENYESHFATVEKIISKVVF